MNNIRVFENKELGTIRSLEMNSEPYFVGNDIATILGYKNARDALNKHVDSEDKGVAKCDTPGGIQELTVINESGLYSLIMSSKLPVAKKFKRWVTSEVLPSIRKNGGYIAGQETLSDDELIQKAFLVATKKLEERERQLEQQKPKVLFADSVETSKNSVLINELAKILKQNGYDIGQNRLFEKLRNEGYLIKQKGQNWNLPTQKAMDMGLFEVKKTVINKPDGTPITRPTTKVTGKGQIYFVHKFLKEVM